MHFCFFAPPLFSSLISFFFSFYLQPGHEEVVQGVETLSAMTTINIAVPDAVIGQIYGRQSVTLHEIIGCSGAQVTVSPRLVAPPIQYHTVLHNAVQVVIIPTYLDNYLDRSLSSFHFLSLQFFSLSSLHLSVTNLLLFLFFTITEVSSLKALPIVL